MKKAWKIVTTGVLGFFKCVHVVMPHIAVVLACLVWYQIPDSERKYEEIRQEVSRELEKVDRQADTIADALEDAAEKIRARTGSVAGELSAQDIREQFPIPAMRCYQFQVLKQGGYPVR